jgi:hypothetical protein
MPAGKLELKVAPGHRYYEKFCLPEGTPADCGEAPFFRADQAVLIGFAKNVSHTKHLSVCIQACIEMSAECRSAMFFGAAGECILSVASAQDAPDVFAEEVDEENVVFFENGCVLDNQIRTQKIQSRAHEAKKPAENKKPESQPTIKLANTTETKPASQEKKSGDKSKSMSGEKKPSSKEEKEKEKSEETGDESGEAKPTLGRRVNNGKETKRILQSATDGAEEAWGAWSEDCRSFDERRPCQNGNRVGFQSRQCLRTPFECQGPFFRYCIAPCEGAQLLSVQ